MYQHEAFLYNKTGVYILQVYPNDKVFVGIPNHLDRSSSKRNCESFGWKLASAKSSSLLDRTKSLMQNNVSGSGQRRKSAAYGVGCLVLQCRHFRWRMTGIGHIASNTPCFIRVR
ncbi:hypothetical protein DPMN_014111 [Dreissena polymorpha]|uniref:Uncharacterized protein n=1 Tax=Dreissena polymorpha TaxID=45954 RepID=A0A9D4N5F0_DREPO|nr:hypothetical protein DPMN_014111 [Dreissena polymorpha]